MYVYPDHLHPHFTSRVQVTSIYTAFFQLMVTNEAGGGGGRKGNSHDRRQLQVCNMSNTSMHVISRSSTPLIPTSSALTHTHKIRYLQHGTDRRK
ncbi:hypothetical protein PoB_001022500 [Plakobranchus ocellatus]|uniref:Uncharacterized protein n=1 Tax=Plakobranchus ocellatus TaxID=259542 RepID=A0AAV3YKT0_9GAST|nr:hypothetical protein PoB_001022500 [Plakobranchus ocellatus]